MTVWVLERFYSIEELQKQRMDICKLRTYAETHEHIGTWNKVFAHYTELIRDNPNGIWLGIAGKTNYRQFCYEAKGVLYRNPDWTFRVVKAEIPFGAESWIGYTDPVVNEKVLRYLYATLQQGAEL